MASSQNERFHERLARQRGAGTHKIANVDFSIQPLGRSSASAPVQAPPSHLPLETPNPKVPIPTQVASAQESPPLRFNHSISRNSSPTVDGAASAKWRSTEPSPLRFGTPGIAESALPVARLASLRRSSTPTISFSSSSALSVSQVNIPTSHVLASRTLTRPSVGRTSTTVEGTKGGVEGQPSPDSFLKMTETSGADRPTGRQSDVLLRGESPVGGGTERGAWEKEASEEVEEEVGGEFGEGSDEDAIADVEDFTMALKEGLEGMVDVVEDMVIQEMEEPRGLAVAIKSPENLNKRRKVVLQKPESEEILLEGTEGSVIKQQGAESLKLKRGWQIAGKKPAQRIQEDKDIHEDINDTHKTKEWRGFEDGLGELEEDQDESSQSPPKYFNPFPHAQPKFKSKPRRRVQRQTGQDGDMESISTFPVIVHRLGKSLGFTLPLGSQRNGVNPIDVINQVSMEIIDKYFFKAESNVERKAIENFKEELSLRFLEVTDALENSIILIARVRQAQKRKAQLMTELLSIKQRRGKIAVEMDDVRKTHELVNKSGETQQHISKTLEDISGTLERGKVRQLGDGETGMDGLEALIRKVSVAVTGGSNSGTGLLATVIEYNKFLERAEKVLSERRRL